MTNRKIAWAGVALAALSVYVLRNARSNTLRGTDAVQRLYDRLAPAYDPAASIFRPLGVRRLQERAVNLLDLHPGDTVVDLGCGTGVNLPILARAVGASGHVIGVDLSSGMLSRAHRRVNRHHLPQVTLEQTDIRDVQLPVGTVAVLATGSLEMIPEYDAVVRELSRQLSPEHGRLAVGGFRRPPGWPSWGVALGRAATAVFGVTRAYEDIRPWQSVQRHMKPIAFETAATGALYLIVAQSNQTMNDGGDGTECAHRLGWKEAD